MKPIWQVTVLGVLLCLLVCARSRTLRSDRWSALDLPANREAFLSALQSYFGGKGIHIDRTAPAFDLQTTKAHAMRNPPGRERGIAAQETNFYENDVEQDEFY
ncbi:hypothetical protein NDU88_002413 [Pleurodeles waltl]|uniref:Uncharacterized protein n=1 Tax=Pleurodeles waltl TaxID=8319 RepID=A0AAV7Q9A2_PLEWA|nr:hypothetical protein NDU88_002413 [Pleurodeles waltl]